MKKASNYAFLSKPAPRSQPQSQPNPNLLYGAQGSSRFMAQMAPMPQENTDLNVFVLSFDGSKQAEKNLAGGDPYQCKKCGAILNKYSTVIPADQADPKYELKPEQCLWNCEFCGYPNTLMIEKQEIPVKDDVVYMLESALEMGESENDATVIFCIDISGSMNTTSTLQGKVDLKFGISQEEIEMLRQFMEPGDEAQFNYLPGQHNNNKTFVSRRQCVLSAIESQLIQIKKNDPKKKVGFVLFNNEVTIVGDGISESIHIVGDKLNKVQDIITALHAFKLAAPLADTYDPLMKQLNKTQAKGQTALGPALLAAIEVASKGSKGSTVVLCTDGLANIGVGNLDLGDQISQKFYSDVGVQAKAKNVSVNIITIKGQGSKLEILGKVVQATNGNVKVVNPQKLSEDFANILKDQVIGLNVATRIMLHKALIFRNQDESSLKDNKTILVKTFANATVNTRISFEYQLRNEDDLKFMEIDVQQLKKVPFQAQITYQSPKGGKFLRVITSESKTTTQRKEMEKQADIGVVHQRVAAKTAQIVSQGQYQKSSSYNNMWSNYLNNNFDAPQYIQKQQTFNQRNARLNQAINNKARKQQQKMMPKREMAEQKLIMQQAEHQEQEKPGFFASLFQKDSKKKKAAPKKVEKEKEKKKEESFDSDEDEMEMQNYMMQKNAKFM